MAIPLGERIKDWFRALPIVGQLASWIIGWQDRRAAQQAALQAAIEAAIAEGDWAQVAGLVIAQIPASILGDIPPLSNLALRLSFGGASEVEQFKDDPQAYLESHLERAFSDPSVRAFTEFVGTIITEPVLSLLEQYAGEDNPDPHAMARSFHGIASGLPWAAGTVDSVLQVVLGKRAPQPGKHIMALYWGLGLGFLGWQTLAPLLSSGLQPNLERYYNRLYRPQRFTPSQASDLFALGERDANWMRDYLRDQGWLDTDIESWLKLSYRELSEGVLWDLYDTGQLSKGEMDTRLRGKGYNPTEIPYLYLSHEKEDVKEADRFLISTVKSALLDGRMGEDEFRTILADMRYHPREIDLLIEEIRLKQTEDQRELTLSNVKLLYSQRVIGRDEASHYLVELDYTSEIAGQLIQAWDNQALPKPVRINKSTILEAFVKGVFTRNQAKERLQADCGYDGDQAELLVKIEETPYPEKVKPPEVAAASLSLLSQFVTAGLITRAELEAREEILRYNPEDRERIISLMFLAPAEEIEELPLGLLESAYILGVITRDELAGRLLARGYTEEDTEIYLTTIEYEHPDVFGEEPEIPGLLKQPRIGDLQLALQRGLIDEAGFRSRLEAQGYSADAVDIFLFNAQYQLPPSPKQLTKADILSLYREQLISRADAQRRLIEVGYLAPDVELLIQRERLELSDTELAEFFQAGLIDPTGFVVTAAEMGFTTEQIEEYLVQFEGGV